MRVNRRFLYWGVFLVSLGGVLVAADLTAVDSATIADALRLWPIAFIAIGLGLVLRRTRFSVAGGMLAAAVPGLVLGGAFAIAPRIAIDCGASAAPSNTAIHEGTFAGPARVSVSTGCGELVVDTASGSDWRLQAGNTRSRTPIISESPRSLSIDAGGREDWHAFDEGRDVWRLTLPKDSLEDLSFAVNAGIGRIDLADAEVDGLRVTTNAADTTVDLSEARVSNLSGTVNAGKLSFSLSAATDMVVSLEVNAGSLQVCAPAGLDLRVHQTGALNGVRVNGLNQTASDWQSPNFGLAAHHADLNIHANLGSVEINPIGGCK
jgi:hypothetical protein